MITLLDDLGPAIWRASWQGAALAIVVAVLLACLGERLSPRWRYLLWSVVLVRLLVVVTPGSSWSVFNVVSWPGDRPQAPATQAARIEPSRALVREAPLDRRTPVDQETEPVAAFTPAAPVDEPQRSEATAPRALPAVPVAVAEDATAKRSDKTRRTSLPRALAAIWLAGSVLCVLRLLASAVVLRRRMAACREVHDASVLSLLEATCRQIGLARRPKLMVTPEAVSPCLVGVWNVRIVVPEALLTESSPVRVRHVLAHELAHIVRGDLWANWLLLAARAVHWFNPFAWWVVRAMQAEREAACDDLALAVLGDRDRSVYAATIIELAAKLAPAGLAPGLIGLHSSARLLKGRVERLLRGSSARPWRAPLAVFLVAAIALIGLTDAMPGAAKDEPPANDAAGKNTQPATTPDNVKTSTAKPAKPAPQIVTLKGRCIDYKDSTPMAGVTVRMFRIAGWTEPIVEFAKRVTDASGNFDFADVEAPRSDDLFERLFYILYADAEGRPVGAGGTWTLHEGEPLYREIAILREETSITGTVRNARGQPVAGALVAQWGFEGRSAGPLSATTGRDGRFEIKRIPDFNKVFNSKDNYSFTVSHPDYPETRLEVADLPGDATATLPDGCVVIGTVRDAVTGRPAAGAVVELQCQEPWNQEVAVTNETGRFRAVVPEGRYNIQASARDRVCVATTDQEFLAGRTVILPEMTMIAGGFIAGQVINAKTGQPVFEPEGDGTRRIVLGLFGPSHPQGHVNSPSRLATVDESGRFVMRAAPGDNFPYFVNTRGDRMSWDTQKQPPVVVKEGQTTVYNMLITPKVPASEKLKAARELVASLPEQPVERTARIIAEFHRQNDLDEDELELWCVLLRELVAIGKPAVPELCAELDRASETRILRKLPFALRAIGDPRAVPALIRAIPRTLVSNNGDYGLIVEDAELHDFMQTHDLDEGKRSVYFGLHGPTRELCGALHKLTGQNFDDQELYGVFLSDDPRRMALQRQPFIRQAQRWQTWWDAHARELTDDPAYQKVNLVIQEQPLPPPPQGPGKLGPNARFGDGGVSQLVLSPPAEGGRFVTYFYDVDACRGLKWPADIPRDAPPLDEKKLAEWAAQSGADLMCVTHRAADGTETFVLRSFGLKIWEISARDHRNLDRLLAASTLPEGRPVDALLMHFNADTEQFEPDVNAAFLFITREGCLGLIETTDRVTRAENITGMFSAPKGVGFHKGVRLNVKPIIP